MSLKSKITGSTAADKEFQQIIKGILPPKELFYTSSGNLPFSTQNEARVPYMLSNPYDATVVGTAFDYLARVIIAKNIKQNKNGAYCNLVAENGLNVLKKLVEPQEFKGLQQKFSNGIGLFEKYVFDENVSIKEIVPTACYLAKLEHIKRSGIPPQNIQKSLLDNTENEIIQDLENLCSVFIDTFIDSNIVNASSVVVFNPTFGMPSFHCGGADADIFIDGTLYDFKTSKDSGYKWQEIAQIIGYYLLNCLATLIDDPFAHLIDYEIEKLALYKARYGEIVYFDVCRLDESRLSDTVNTLKSYFELE